MKKLILFVAVITAFSFASCKKDRTCTCTESYSDGSPSFTFVATILKSRKSDAKKECINQTTTDSLGITTTTCKLN